MVHNNIGISCYPGLNISLQDNIEYIKLAAQKGIKRCFLSAHIPEQNNDIYYELTVILKLLKDLDFQIVIDISKNYLNQIKPLLEHEMHLRLDFGFTKQEIVDLSHQYFISINASTIDEAMLKELIILGLNLKQVDAFHNFYLKPFTGLTLDYYYNQNQMFKKYNLLISSFVGGQTYKRPPLKQSLVTLEEHRQRSLFEQIQELKLLGSDFIYFGDLKTSTEELVVLVNQNNNFSPFQLIINSSHKLTNEEIRLLKSTHQLRVDNSGYMLRSDKLNLNYTDFNIVPNHNDMPIEAFDVTIDNNEFSRYKGELNIWLKHGASSKRINVVGKLQNHYILKYLNQHRYSFILKK
ncbi:MupG family TIM beta-alpha barrel fold protein [Spiroplasma endosymbiont of Amphibalanus improvisus]|uniref:MupG family TIM beta-alpha barrel fold protein n=1 Tax=Spiroplasma endosymbiont of Amphibalanus improvisus TaxID=3066327 RepID=UPI00313C34E6